jgi:rRNA maturation protein Nop10
MPITTFGTCPTCGALGVSIRHAVDGFTGNPLHVYNCPVCGIYSVFVAWACPHCGKHVVVAVPDGAADARR